MTGNQELNQNSKNLSHLQDSAVEQSANEQGRVVRNPATRVLPFPSGKPSASGVERG
jgi:hypothetical protein